MAPYCAILRDYLSDTPLLRAMGFLVSQHGQLGAIPPPPFLSVSPLEHMRTRGAIPPLKRGISAILPRYPMKTRQMGAIPPSAILSRKGIARYGGVSRIGPLSARFCRLRLINCWSTLNQYIANYRPHKKLQEPSLSGRLLLAPKTQRCAPAEWNLREIFRFSHRFWRDILVKVSVPKMCHK